MKKLSFEQPCPKCGKRLTIVVEKMRPGAHQDCPSCGARIEFTGDDGRKAQKAMDDLLRTLKRLGK